MNMKTRFTIQKSNRAGSALLLVMILSAVALLILAGVMTWAATSTRLTHRSIQYTRSVAAAEAATEKAESQIAADFLYGGEAYVSQNLNNYRQNTLPTVGNSSYWTNWIFDDGNGNLNQTYVQRVPGTSYVVLDAPYAGLKGYVSTYTVVSHASDTANLQDVNAGVLQQLRLTGIPIFQFGMYSSGDMEISCGQQFNITGHVHSNGTLYVEPDAGMTFESDVTAVVTVLPQREPLDTRGPPANTAGAVYVQPGSPSFPVAALTLPIGATNTPEAIREIIEPPEDPTEDPNSAIGILRYFNQCDLVLTVSDTGVTGVSGHFNPIQTTIPTNDLALFVSYNAANFWDGREGKMVQPIDIDIGKLTAWSLTNTHLPNLSSIYVVDSRTLLTLSPANLGAVRVLNGTNLPIHGLTVATGRPLYVWGDYNAPILASTNTSTSLPASLVADAITILSGNWKDENQQSAVLNTAADTTVNAALLTGDVPTTLGHYSGGMENFPRFLEDWSSSTSTYNGSMVKMFPSQWATGVWGDTSYYKPPKRNWAYDSNFDNPTNLPPKTPSLLKVIRGQWATVAPNTNAASAFP
jgi:Tfp pilus assembly protein PilX